jgi:hypothetical protein
MTALGRQAREAFLPSKRLFCNTSHPALQPGWRAAIGAKFRAWNPRASAFSRLAPQGRAMHQKKL